MKYLILVLNNDGDVSEYCNLLNKSYAELHNIDYKCLCIKDTTEGRAIQWASIPVLYKYIEDYDYICYVHPNVCIIDQKVNLFSLFETTVPLVLISDSSIEHSYGIIINCIEKQKIKDVLNLWWNCGYSEFYNRYPYEFGVFTKWIHDESKKCFSLIKNNTTFCHINSKYKNIQINVVQKHLYKFVNSKNYCKKAIGLVMRIQNFYSNGAGQNALFMKHALEATGHDVDIITYTNETVDILSESIPYTVLNGLKVDLSKYCTFFFGSLVPPRDEIKRIKDAGIKTIMFNPVNVVDGFHVENFLYKEKSASMPLFEMTFKDVADECWIIETHENPSMEYLNIINRKKLPIYKVPQVWSPLFLLKDNKFPIYAKRTNPTVDIVILEPNMSYCKCGWIPLVISEKLYLENPDKLNKVYFFNTPESNPTAMGMIKSLKVYEDNKIKLMNRMAINEILAFFADSEKTGNRHVIFISNQINVPYNYVYYELLYSGFPLLHNSQPLKNSKLGHFYEDLSGAVSEIHKIMESTESISNTVAQEFCEKHSPYDPDVINSFKTRLDCLTPKYEFEDLSKPLVITYDNKPTDGTHYFCKTMERNQWDFKVIGEGETWKGWRTRMIAYVKALEKLPPKKIVVLSDARDVFCIRGSKTFIKAFESYKKPVVASMEIFCEAYDYWREELKTHVQCMTLATYWKHHNITTIPDRKFVNNGLVAGYAENLKEIYQWMYDKGYTDDQFGLGNYVITFPDNVATDWDAKLLHTSTFGVNAGVQYIHKQANDSPTLAELNGNRAYFLHISGQANKGQKLVYEQVKMILESGLVRPCILTEAYKYNEPDFDEKF